VGQSPAAPEHLLLYHFPLLLLQLEVCCWVVGKQVLVMLAALLLLLSRVQSPAAGQTPCPTPPHTAPMVLQGDPTESTACMTAQHSTAQHSKAHYDSSNTQHGMWAAGC
jgi:hypothetical protein